MVVTDVLTRLRFRRRALAGSAVVAALAVLTGLVVEGAVSSAERERDAYGRARTVLVATRALPAGHVLESADLTATRWPAGLVPDGALDDMAAVTGRHLSAAVVAGEALVAARVAPDGLSVVAGLVPAGRRGVLVPAGPGLPPLEVGDRVDLVAAADALDPLDPLAAATPAAVVVARDAPVVAVADDGATVAVAAEEVPDAVVALTGASLVVALTGR